MSVARGRGRPSAPPDPSAPQGLSVVPEAAVPRPSVAPEGWRAQVPLAPAAPGVYRFSDAGGTVLYVGKAKSLRDRLTSYLGPPRSPLNAAMLDLADRLEWTQLSSEADALVHEWQLIRRHRPRYNVRLKDDRTQAVLHLSDQPFPRLSVRRAGTSGSGRQFGPYPSRRDAQQLLDLVLPAIPVRSCSDTTFASAERSGRPCLLADISRCAAPCVGRVDRMEHQKLADRAASFLSGDRSTLELTASQLESSMREAAQDRRFEAAAQLRDRLAAVRAISRSRQQVAWDERAEFDAVTVVSSPTALALAAFFVRSGALTGQQVLLFERPSAEESVCSCPHLSDLAPATSTEPDSPPPRTRSCSCVPFESMLAALYLPGSRPLPRLLVSDRDVAPGTMEALHAARGSSATTRTRRVVRGRMRELLDTVARNGQDALRRDALSRVSDARARASAAEQLAAALGLGRPPLRLECIDISHLGGTGTVGSLVAFEDALPRRDLYRSYKLSHDVNDDPASVAEVVSRRLRRAADGSLPAPDLLVVDGGPTQLAAAVAAQERLLAELGGTPGPGLPVPLCALSKRFEELWLPGSDAPVRLPAGSEALYLVQRVRDEAHRRAVSHQRRRRTASLASQLDRVRGVGPARRATLLSRYGTVAAVLSASDDELTSLPGISKATVAELRRTLAPTVG